MKYLAATLIAFGLSASPALAQERETATKRPQMCKMMHNGKEMHGVMVKGEDGKMTCQMRDHAGSDHSQMDHSSMDHSSSDHSAMDHGEKRGEAREASQKDKPQSGHDHS